MGSPFSLNLRNLAWHGFALPGELSPALANTLLLLLPSIGQLLQQKGFATIQPRPCVSISRVQLMYASFENRPQPGSVSESDSGVLRSLKKCK